MTLVCHEPRLFAEIIHTQNDDALVMMMRKKSLHRFIGTVRVTNQDRASMIH
jgi:hypothetical protein